MIGPLHYTYRVVERWEKETTTMEECAGCKSPIFSAMYRLCIDEVSPRTNRKLVRRTDMVICESCMNLLNNYNDGDKK